MTLLDLQTMETVKDEATADAGYGGGSEASLLLCGDSSLSLTTCN
ncbi:SapB/AmfS family lanthipeptide [Streptomyces sp. JJ36]|nr:SapB/AmfS family lanthipeptide [Streptomyces sp. JJ36]MCF6522297.1 SapB/AmfS family lanthipeptide [Streptomyces sp. JJ36]